MTNEARTNIFVSYSHLDREWRDRLELHLALLQRQDRVDLWSDTRIAMGQGWAEEIEAALANAHVAVLLVSPAFLASEYIWREEMPRIMTHQAAGMRVLPLIVRPCAWRLAGEVARLQTRPAGARALSSGSEAQIDADLAEFVVELAKMIKAVPTGMITDWSQTPAGLQSGDAEPEPSTEASPQWAGSLARVWNGRYDAALSPPSSAVTMENLTLRIEMIGSDRFSGQMEYDEGDVITEVRGQIRLDGRSLANDAAWPIAPTSDLAVTFHEPRFIKRGVRPVTLDGTYRAYVADSRMWGGWFSKDGVKRGTFSFSAKEEQPSSVPCT